MNPTISTFNRLVENDLAHLAKKHSHYNDNLNPDERQALKDLQSDPNLVIRSADKGGAVVIQSFEQYDKGIKAHLLDNKFYLSLCVNPTERIKTEIDSSIEAALTVGWITANEQDFLITKHPICPLFYGLPKIHKRLDDPPLRPAPYCVRNR